MALPWIIYHANSAAKHIYVRRLSYHNKQCQSVWKSWLIMSLWITCQTGLLELPVKWKKEWICMNEWMMFYLFVHFLRASGFENFCTFDFHITTFMIRVIQPWGKHPLLDMQISRFLFALVSIFVKQGIIFIFYWN